MKNSLTTVWLVSVLLVLGSAGRAMAIELPCKGTWSCHRPGCYAPWHGNYYNVSWGMPVALLVPPTAEFQTHWGWGVGNTRITPICSQFGRNWPGPGVYNRAGFLPTPPWPSDTDQMGVYYVRGPW